MVDNVEADPIESRLVLRRIQASVVEWVPAIAPHSLSIRRSSVEHQDTSATGVFSEDTKHAALIVDCEMKEAIPGENSGEFLTNWRRAHVANDPPVAWHSLLT